MSTIVTRAEGNVVSLDRGNIGGTVTFLDGCQATSSVYVYGYRGDFGTVVTVAPYGYCCMLHRTTHERKYELNANIFVCSLDLLTIVARAN